MDANKILTADLLDIIFEGKNKEYGAYELRKTYTTRLRNAFFVMIGICLVAFLGAFLVNTTGSKKQGPMMVQDVQLANVKQEKPKPPPPPPPPPPPKPPPKVEITKFTPPKIVKDEQVKEPPPEQAKLVDTKIGVINQEGIKTNIVAPPLEQGTGVVAAPKDDQDYDKEFKSVQIDAQFPGGFDAWSKYLQRNLNSEVPIDNGAPAGSYTVTVSFLVDKDGNISQVKAENDPGYGTAAEAVRVIERGPKWIPAVQNGRNVIYRHRQKITFTVQDE